MNSPLEIILGIAGALGVFGLVIGWLARSGRRLQAEQKARLARSQPAQATVVQVGKSVPQTRNGTVIVKLRLEVTPPGGASYGVTTAWEVPQANLPQVQAGQRIAVRIDPDDDQVVYPGVSWAEFSRVYREAWVKDRRKAKG